MTSFFSVDVETDGLGPGVHSLLSIGIVHYTQEYARGPEGLGDGPLTLKKVGEFSVNLEREPGYKVLPSTMVFWDQFPEAYAKTRKPPLSSPLSAATTLKNWLDAVCPERRDRVFVADPASFDFGMISHLAHKYLGEDQFHYKTIDLSSLRHGLNVSRADVKEASAHMTETQHTALGDARIQGVEFEFLWMHGMALYGQPWALQW